MTAIPSTARPARAWVRPVLALLAAGPSLFGLMIVGLIAAGPLGLAAPVVWLAAVYGYRRALGASEPSPATTAFREIGGIALGAALGFGTYAAMMFLGIFVGAIGFMGTQGGHPDEWNALGILVSIIGAAATWAVLRSDVLDGRR